MTEDPRRWWLSHCYGLPVADGGQSPLRRCKVSARALDRLTRSAKLALTARFSWSFLLFPGSSHAQTGSRPAPNASGATAWSAGATLSVRGPVLGESPPRRLRLLPRAERKRRRPPPPPLLSASTSCSPAVPLPTANDLVTLTGEGAQGGGAGSAVRRRLVSPRIPTVGG